MTQSECMHSPSPSAESDPSSESTTWSRLRLRCSCLRGQAQVVSIPVGVVSDAWVASLTVCAWVEV